MTQILPPPFNRNAVDDDGVLTQELRVFFSDLVNRIPAHGEGTPEGNIRANLGATYYDLSLASGTNRVYIKVKDSIDGDQTKGWELA